MLSVYQTAPQVLSLSNGITLIHTDASNAPRLAISFVLPSGYSMDPVPGTIELMSRLLFKGTKTRSQEEIALEIDELTLDIGASVRRDYLTIQATLLEEDLQASVQLLSDIFYNTTFEELAKEKQKLFGEIMMELDSSKACAADLMVKTLWQGTSYSASNSQIMENLEGIAISHLQQLHQEVFSPANLTIVTTGAIPVDTLISCFEHHFPAPSSNPEPLSKTKIAGFTPITDLQQLSTAQDKTVSLAKDDSSQAHIYKAWLMPKITSPDFASIALMNTILGAAGLTSRLFLELRDKQGLAYNVRSTYEAYLHKGMFYLYIGTDPANKEKCLEGFNIEVNKLCTIPIPEDELADAKRNWLGRRSIMLETASQKVAYLGANISLGRSLSDISDLPEKIERVTAADIQAIAKKYLTQPAITSIAAPSHVL